MKRKILIVIDQDDEKVLLRVMNFIDGELTEKFTLEHSLPLKPEPKKSFRDTFLNKFYPTKP